MLAEGGPAFCATPAADTAPLVAEVQFNHDFLQKDASLSLDISRFNKGNIAAPGRYRAEVFVNDLWIGNVDVLLRQHGADMANVVPCLDRAMLDRFGVDFTKLDDAALAEIESTECLDVARLIPGASAIFDNGEQRLVVSVPQAAMLRNARGYVDPKFWDDGINAARLQYNANVYRADYSGNSYMQSYVSVNAGFNVGPWRFNHMGSYSHVDTLGGTYQALQTNLKRSIASFKSQLTIGDGFTDGQLFDSVGFRGAQLASDDRMYPESQRGYAPTVRGIASTTARVQIRQNGNVIYETTVQPGAFEIDDLYATGYGGDLEVLVTEADGSVHVTKVPYAAAVNALRPGVTRFSVTGGQYRNSNTAIHPFLVQATIQHGFSNLITGYAGLTLAEHYASGLVGIALNTDIGAVGADITYARANLAHQPDRSGQSYRISYTKLVPATNTNLTLAAYRYSTQGYLGLADAMSLRDLDSQHLAQGMTGIQRGRLQLTLNQALPLGWGSLYFSGSTQDYWNRSGRDTQFTLGYNNSYRRISYGLAASREYNLGQNKWVNRVMLTAGLPLGSAAHAPYAVTSLERIATGATNLRESVSGTLGEDNRFTYGINAARTFGGGVNAATAGGANATYVSRLATLNASVSAGTNYTQVSAGLAGGVVAYSDGVVFAPVMGETIAVVEAKDAAGAQVLSAAGLRVDPWGRAIAANMIPFARNQIELDPKGLPMSVQLKSTTMLTNPTAGAVTRAKFETENLGQATLIRASLVNGKPLPFGAIVLDAHGQQIGVVGQGSKILANLRESSGDLVVKWGQEQASRCGFSFNFPDAGPEAADMPFRQTTAVCQGQGGAVL
ncbi:fimbria/pilus outer membrane usher protein [Cupriavidus pauculus]|uniref:fimbria/pilus outer membrane usher protein n=1 Tax=Cupriavidus pauculus TaxID=82633 RepID=UPI001EE25AD5|nr:fimbria/pilus outer membrane usher protein [Cupriavidus pauculus]GJG98152.1 fimbrial biogenesis outer membrane usher protein [Cupriavidus pauculus]